MDSIDKKLIGLIATEFPLTGEPYAELGQRLGIGAGKVIERIAQLKQRGIVRQIGPVFNFGNLGYRTTLVAMKVPDARLKEAERAINEHQGISHGYLREHSFNIWFTLSLPHTVDMEDEIVHLSRATGTEAVVSLPARKVFKIGTYFALNGRGGNAPAVDVSSARAEPVELSPDDRLLINSIQQELPLAPAPYNGLAEKSGMDIALFLDRCRRLRERGVIWKFSASINYNQAGLTANALVCWNAPPDTIDNAGQRLASLKEVSHCYERRPAELWQYNLFAMIHSRSRKQCRQIIDKACNDTGLTEYELLYSTGELKKTRIHYEV
jgi:DNA-binding Lrp family transcriptional regulator